MSTIFNMVRDVSGAVSFILPDATDKYCTTLVSNVAQSVTIPDNYEWWEIIFSYQPGSSVWTCLNGTASVPSGSMATTKSSLNKVGIKAKAGDIISLITSGASVAVGIEMYALPSSNTIVWFEDNMLFNNGRFGEFKNCMTDSLFVEEYTDSDVTPPIIEASLLQENGGLLLQENGGKILLS